jgi:hypothetical protein
LLRIPSCSPFNKQGCFILDCKINDLTPQPPSLQGKGEQLLIKHNAEKNNFSLFSASTSNPKTIKTQMITLGGATLKTHWEMGNALNALKQDLWDYVVLQEQSMLPIIEPQTIFLVVVKSS